jgi:peroxiredoxin
MYRRLLLTALPMLAVCFDLCGPHMAFRLAAAGDAEPPEGTVAEDVETSGTQLAEGHSSHGEVFNKGPRQAAYLMTGVGNIRFEVTSDDQEVTAFVVQGIGQLHGFWFFESERSFRQAAAIDPDCAIAYWGMAMSNRKNAERAKGFISKAVEFKENSSRREQLYIEAFDRYINSPEDEEKEERATRYIEDLESLLFEFPDDIEAKAFLCEFQWSARRDGLEFSSYLSVDALIQQVLDVEPQHSVHHYRIHLWDKKRAKKALQAAALCGPAAPSIAHMWHMPGHIYSRLNRYHDAVWQQEASARVDHAHMMKDMVLPDQIHNFAHNNEWCIRNLIHIGRVHDAIDLAKNMIELPRHPEYNHIERSGSYKYGRQRLIDVLQTFQMHEELIGLAATSWLQTTGDESADLTLDRALAAAYVATDHPSDAEAIRVKLETLLNEVTTQGPEDSDNTENEADAESQDAEELEKATEAAKKKYDTRVADLQHALDEIDGRLAAQREEYDVAVELLQKADGVPVEDIVAVLTVAGKSDEAVTQITSHVAENEHQIRPLAALILAHWNAGDKDEARKAFETLRTVSSVIDLDIPVFAELAPVASELGYSGDWRVVREQPLDLGSRPSLDSLGPFRWQPFPAPDWTLKGIDNQTVSSSDLGTKPRVLVFYLGIGCLHCAEQLQKFQPAAEKFRDAGFDLVAISTDPQERLSKSRLDYDDEFAFQLFADPNHAVFRAYRCFDDFEQQPLHGTFVIDSNGSILWHDISYEPFMDPEYVLKEAQRLISLADKN